jgi:phosphatidylethanolamine-binding protein (PEBP) family uncharacterized protein
LRWGGVPSGTAELVLFILHERPHDQRLAIDWAVAALSPKLSGLAAGQLPGGAVVGRNSLGQNGYSICPEKGWSQIYTVALFALPHALSVSTGFNALSLYKQIEPIVRVQGLTSARYTRADHAARP